MTPSDRSGRPRLIPVNEENQEPITINIGLSPLTSIEKITPAGDSEQAIDILARTVWAEARGEGQHGMEAVAAVILNRLTISKQSGGFWWGNDIVSICKAPWQFSCWNPGDPNLPKLQRVDSRDAEFASAQRIARRAINGFLDDPTVDVNTGIGATHYHHRAMQPRWAKGSRPISSIGNHVFYHLA